MERRTIVRVAEHSSVVAVHKCRIRVEGELRKTEEGRARLQAAATRVGDAPTGRALKRVRFAGDRVDSSAEVPTDHTAGSHSVSASSTLPAETASSSSTSAPPAESVSSTSAADVPDQVGVKRSSAACSHSESGTNSIPCQSLRA